MGRGLRWASRRSGRRRRSSPRECGHMYCSPDVCPKAPWFALSLRGACGLPAGSDHPVRFSAAARRLIAPNTHALLHGCRYYRRRLAGRHLRPHGTMKITGHAVDAVTGPGKANPTGSSPPSPPASAEACARSSARANSACALRTASCQGNSWVVDGRSPYGSHAGAPVRSGMSANRTEQDDGSPDVISLATLPYSLPLHLEPHEMHALQPVSFSV